MRDYEERDREGVRGQDGPVTEHSGPALQQRSEGLTDLPSSAGWSTASWDKIDSVAVQFRRALIRAHSRPPQILDARDAIGAVIQQKLDELDARRGAPDAHAAPRERGAAGRPSALGDVYTTPEAAQGSGPATYRQPLDARDAIQALVQRKLDAASRADSSIHEAAARGTAGGGGSLPHLEQIQESFGQHDVSAVQAHVGGAAADANRAMGAIAYATGNHVAFSRQPDLHTAAHEAAHVVQQRAGVSLKGGVSEVGDRYEQHADAVADRVVAGRSAETLLGAYAPANGGGSGVQRLEAGDEEASEVPECRAEEGPKSGDEEAKNGEDVEAGAEKKASQPPWKTGVEKDVYEHVAATGKAGLTALESLRSELGAAVRKGQIASGDYKRYCAAIARISQRYQTEAAGLQTEFLSALNDAPPEDLRRIQLGHVDPSAPLRELLTDMGRGDAARYLEVAHRRTVATALLQRLQNERAGTQDAKAQAGSLEQDLRQTLGPALHVLDLADLAILAGDDEGAAHALVVEGRAVPDPVRSTLLELRERSGSAAFSAMLREAARPVLVAKAAPTIDTAVALCRSLPGLPRHNQEEDKRLRQLNETAQSFGFAEELRRAVMDMERQELDGLFEVNSRHVEYDGDPVSLTMAMTQARMLVPSLSEWELGVGSGSAEEVLVRMRQDHVALFNTAMNRSQGRIDNAYLWVCAARDFLADTGMGYLEQVRRRYYEHLHAGWGVKR